MKKVKCNHIKSMPMNMEHMNGQHIGWQILFAYCPIFGKKLPKGKK